MYNQQNPLCDSLCEYQRALIIFFGQVTVGGTPPILAASMRHIIAHSSVQFVANGNLLSKQCVGAPASESLKITSCKTSLRFAVTDKGLWWKAEDGTSLCSRTRIICLGYIGKFRN